MSMYFPYFQLTKFVILWYEALLYWRLNILASTNRMNINLESIIIKCRAVILYTTQTFQGEKGWNMVYIGKDFTIQPFYCSVQYCEISYLNKFNVIWWLDFPITSKSITVVICFISICTIVPLINLLLHRYIRIAQDAVF